MKRFAAAPAFLAAMPLLAGLHEAFAAAGRDMEHQPSIEWLSTFCNELALRLPLSLILAFTVFALIGAAGAFLAARWARASRHKLRDITSI